MKIIHDGSGINSLDHTIICSGITIHDVGSKDRIVLHYVDKDIIIVNGTINIIGIISPNTIDLDFDLHL